MDNKEAKVKQQFKEMDTLLLEAEKEFIQFKKNNLKLKSFLKKINTLEQFYHSDEWLEGRELIYKNNTKNEYYYSASEDAIWDLTQNVYIEKIKLLKKIIKSI